jgi:hypothetical protein
MELSALSWLARLSLDEEREESNEERRRSNKRPWFGQSTQLTQWSTFLPPLHLRSLARRNQVEGKTVV